MPSSPSPEHKDKDSEVKTKWSSFIFLVGGLAVIGLLAGLFASGLISGKSSSSSSSSSSPVSSQLRSCASYHKETCTCHAPLPNCTCSPFAPSGLRRVAQPIRVSGSRFVDPRNRTVTLKGINWYGFENGDKFLGSLWVGSNYGNGYSCLARDVSLITHRLRLLGFNALRLPFIFSELEADIPGSRMHGCVVPSSEQVKMSLLPDELKANASLYRLPAYEGWGCVTPGNVTYQTHANFYIPGPDPDGGGNGGTVMDQFVWLVQYFIGQGFYVMIDYHPYPVRDTQQYIITENPTWSSPEAFAAKWRSLLSTFAALPSWPSVRGRLLVDLANEFDLLSCKWDRGGDALDKLGGVGCPPYQDLVAAATAALTEVYPAQIVVVEGVGQGEDRCDNHGDGFRADTGTLGSSAKTYFDSIPANASITLSTHIYCKYLGDKDCLNDPDGLASRFDLNWGHKSVGDGYNGRLFPYLVGEIGAGWDEADEADFEVVARNTDTDFKTTGEKECMNTIQSYLASSVHRYENGTETQHARPSGVFWWCWNFNSVGTGGLTWHTGGHSDQEGIAIKWYKIEWMRRAVGLRAWFDTGK